jgi:hypothetical protein
MDRNRVRNKVLLDLLAGPATVIPAALGATLLAVAWAVDQHAAALAFLGVSSLLASVGTVATRWIFGAERMTARAMQSLADEEARGRSAALDALDKRLRTDQDPRPEDWLAELRSMYQGFVQDRAWRSRLSEPSAAELAGKVENLFQGCIISLQRSADLMDTAGSMATRDGRRSVLDARERLLEEVSRSVAQVARAIDDVRSLRLETDDGERLARIRQELDESLDVARRVEDRLQTLETELERPAGERIVRE